MKHSIELTRRRVSDVGYRPLGCVLEGEVHLSRIAAILPVSISIVVLRTKRSTGRVIAVDDGSSDRPAEVADLAGAEAIMHPVDISRAREIGYEPEPRLEYRLAETIEWFCS